MMLQSLWNALPVLALAILSVESQTAPNKVAAAWYAGWHSTEGYPLSKVSWSKYTHLTYAFAETTPSVHTLSLNGTNPYVLPRFVKEAHKNGVKALVSVGGWGGSKYYSNNVGSAENRTAFVKTITRFAEEHHLDGIDFDWEYPARQGIGCNTINTNDSQNFLMFLQELRTTPIGSKLIITAATSIAPFTGPDGNPLTDVSEFARVIDFIAIMNYDVWGSWSATVGPNAPLNDTCAESQNKGGSAVSAVQAWEKAGFPSDQISLGVPSYGYSFSVNNTNAFVAGSTDVLAPYPKFNASVKPKGDAWDTLSGPDVCGNPTDYGGTIEFWGLVSLGYLNSDGTPNPGIFYRYDSCSQTPYVYNATTQIMVSFDNVESFAAKGNFIHQNGLRGFSMWEAGGDFYDMLLDSIREAAQIQ